MSPAYRLCFACVAPAFRQRYGCLAGVSPARAAFFWRDCGSFYRYRRAIYRQNVHYPSVISALGPSCACVVQAFRLRFPRAACDPPSFYLRCSIVMPAFRPCVALLRLRSATDTPAWPAFRLRAPPCFGEITARFIGKPALGWGYSSVISGIMPNFQPRRLCFSIVSPVYIFLACFACISCVLPVSPAFLLCFAFVLPLFRICLTCVRPAFYLCAPAFYLRILCFNLVSPAFYLHFARISCVLLVFRLCFACVSPVYPVSTCVSSVRHAFYISSPCSSSLHPAFRLCFICVPPVHPVCRLCFACFSPLFTCVSPSFYLWL